MSYIKLGAGLLPGINNEEKFDISDSQKLRILGVPKRIGRDCDCKTSLA